MAKRWYLTFAVIVLSSMITAGAAAQEAQLGKVEFQTSGSKEAQASFLRGLAALHSFWYEEALEAFKASTKSDPEFMMGYWGEAMAYNHPLWGEQDTPTARSVLAKIKDTPKLSARERAYLNAVKLLYGEGDKRARDTAYSAAMEKLYLDYPDDLDAAAFYALSLLGQVRSEEKSFRLQARAGAIALEVYRRNPNHPGAAHYIIHAFDDPEHAILALPAALRYADIAPEAHHARHMPSHIFLQLGMWPEAAASNESAWEVSNTWMKRKNLSPSVRDYHSLHWLSYVYLQQGRYHKAEELLALMKQTMSDTTYENKLRPGYYENNYANMAAAYVVETERWEAANTLFPPTDSNSVKGEAMGSHGHGMSTTVTDATLRTSDRGQRLPMLILGFASARKGNITMSQMQESSNIGELEVAAVAASVKDDHDYAIKLMTKAVELEDKLGPPSGPPSLVKPPHELFGELLLRAGKPAEAAEQFRASLLRQPNRARSLLGSARAAAKSGDRASAEAAYSRFLAQWSQADPDLPELKEAKDYLRNLQGR
jgi:hypothetical protein